jgi:hypothetical protein
LKRTQLAQKITLIAASNEPLATEYLIGFDGFIDEILDSVAKRQDSEHYTPIETIRDFGLRILEAEEKGTNLELVTKKIKIGGNGPILASSLIAQGHLPSLIGTLGAPLIEPLFLPLTEKCKKVISIAAPGHTDAIEFSDSKILFGKMSHLLNCDKTCLEEHISKQELISLFSEIDIFASVNWTMLLGMTSIWNYLIEEILPHVAKKEGRILFVDLADPAKRSRQDIEKALETLKKFKEFYTVILGLNELEAKRLLALFGADHPLLNISTLSKEQTLHITQLLQGQTELDLIVLHTLKHAACSSNSETLAVDGPFCVKPYLTTGGGDNFNGGFLSALGLGLSFEEALLMGVVTSGFYVRTGVSPSLKEISAFLRAWDRDPLELELPMKLAAKLQL